LDRSCVWNNSYCREIEDLNWTSDDAWRACGDLLQSLVTEFPAITWDKADADGDDGVIWFTNDDGNRVKVKISREALEDYLEANEREQSRQEHKLAECMKEINESGLLEALIEAAHLSG